MTSQCLVYTRQEREYTMVLAEMFVKESFLQFVILPTSAKVVCSFSPQDLLIATLSIVYSNLRHVACVEYW